MVFSPAKPTSRSCTDHSTTAASNSPRSTANRSASHWPTPPLATVESLTVDDVIAEPTFDFPTTDRAWRNYWSGADFRQGHPPARYVAQFRTLEGLIASIRAGLGVYFATEGLVTAAGPGMVWRRLDELPPLQHSIARRADDHRPLVQSFIDTAVATLAV